MSKKWLNPEAVMSAVSQVSGLPRETIIGRSRVQHVSIARKIMAHLLYERSDMSYMSIAHVMDNRDHSSIIYINKQALNLPTELVSLHESKAEELHQRLLDDIQM